MKPTSEAAFETLIEQHQLAHGYIARPGAAAADDADLARLPDDLLGFIAETQPTSRTKQQPIHSLALRVAAHRRAGRA